MTISDSTVAIIGTGNLVGRLAAAFAAGGQDFLLAGRDEETARKLASDLGGHAEVVSVAKLLGGRIGPARQAARNGVSPGDAEEKDEPQGGQR